MADTEQNAAPKSSTVKKLSWILPIVLLLVGVLAYPTVRYQFTHVVTDDAFVDAPLLAVSPSIQGRLAWVKAAEGDTVRAHQAIAQLDDGIRRAELSEMEARVTYALGLLTEAELAFQIEQRKTGPMADREQAELVAWQARLAGAQAQLQDAERKSERVTQLANSGLVSKSEFESARAHRDRLSAALDAIREEVHKATASHKLTQGVLQALALHQQRIETARANIKRAEAEREAAQLRLKLTEITSPVRGVVARVLAHTGERLEEGQAICLIRDLDALWIVANVEETQIRHVAPDQPADITVDAFPNRTFKGQVRHVGPVTKAQFALIPRQSRAGNFVKVLQRIPVTIAVNDPDSLLKPGMSAIVGIDIASSP
jgi:membrane fusion protein (multidrug efflux system)